MKRNDGNSLAAGSAAAFVPSRGISVEQGFRVILTNCLDQVHASASGLLQQGDPESIHQMRVGIRRLRSAMRLWARWVPFQPALREELRWLAGVLGAARDADVLASSTLLQVVAACPQDEALRRLKLGASAMAAQKRRQAAKAVASARCSRVMLGVAEGLQASRWQPSVDQAALRVLDEPIEEHARRILDRCHDQLLKRGRHLVQGTPEQRHRVRIAAKQARHAAEFLLTLRPRAPLRRGLGRLSALQDRPGHLNDMAVADRLLLELGARRPELAGAASFA